MFKKIGLPLMALAAVLAVTPNPAKAAVRVGVYVGAPAYRVYSPLAPRYVYQAPPYVYAAPAYVAPYRAWDRRQDRRDHRREEWREHQRHDEGIRDRR
jgi:hypothetical protein